MKNLRLTANFIKEKAKAKKLFNSKNFDRLRDEAIEKGSLPYKILKYKRVVAPEKTPMPLSPTSYVHPENFEKQIEYLTKKASVISLDQLIDLIEKNKKIPERTVVITFDYGHMDSYLYAFPVLLKNQLHATFFISSGYIESDVFLYNDRLILSLINVRNQNKLLPEYDFLPEDMREDAKKISPQGEVTEELINFITAGMSLANSTERLMLMRNIANFKDTPELLEYEDFMRWEDLAHLQSVGYSIANMGHFSISSPDIDEESFKYDLGYSIKEYEKNKIKLSAPFCLPDRAIRMNTYKALSELNCRYVLNEIFYPEPRFQTKTPMILSRKTISQANSSSIEFFACHLWDINLDE